MSDAFTFLLHLERRFAPFVRPAFDAVLRDPIATFTTALIKGNARTKASKSRKEKPLPNEEIYFDSIIW